MIFDLPFAASGDRVFRRVFQCQLIPAASEYITGIAGEVVDLAIFGVIVAVCSADACPRFLCPRVSDTLS